jgi:hypothetical protein
MGVLIGSEDFVSTWGRFRTAIANQNPSLVNRAHNIEFLSGFKADTGNGLLRFDAASRVILITQPVVAIGDYGGGDAFIFEQSWFPGVITEDNQVQFLGQTVNATGGSFTITTDAFNSNLGQSVIGIATAPIIDIGLLTPL